MSTPAFDRTIAILGHPTTPDVRWTEERLAAIRDVGFDTIQMSIAWASKPAAEVLNLEDLEDPANLAEWQHRAELAKSVGFRTLAHFGLPKGLSAEEPRCILDPAVREDCRARMTRLFDDFPGIDEVMIYTYDQLAWLCSEFGDCPRCQGVPLHERLTPFLEEMVDAVQASRPGARLWWEPWELSAGQTFAIADAVRPDHFGLLLHHTIAEVEFVNQTDLWFRNLARLAGRRGIPVVGECFLGGAGEDVHPATHLPCPRLVYQELDALRRTEGVVGAKEYYGLVPEDFSANVAMVAAYLRAPDAALDDLLAEVAEGYPSRVRTTLVDAWELVATAMELFPWDASWLLRHVFDGSRYGDPARVEGVSWMTPSWQSNRRGFYLVTDEPRQHPWLREDVGLRAVLAGRRFADAADLLDRTIPLAGEMSGDVTRQAEDVRRAAEVSQQYGQARLDHLVDTGYPP